MGDWSEKREEEEEEGYYGKAREHPGEDRGKRVEKVGGEEKCGKERVKSRGNSSCCPSTLLQQVSDEFLLFGFLDAHSASLLFLTPPCFFHFFHGGLSSIPVWIEGIGVVKEKRKKNT